MDEKLRNQLSPWSKLAETLKSGADSVVTFFTPDGEEVKAENQKIGQGIKSKIDADKAAAFKRGFEGK